MCCCLVSYAISRLEVLLKLFIYLLLVVVEGMSMGWGFPVLRFMPDVQDGDVLDHSDTLDSVVAASELPISIVVAGLSSKVSRGRGNGRSRFWGERSLRWPVQCSNNAENSIAPGQSLFLLTKTHLC